MIRALCCAFLLGGAARAAAPPTVAELFTSESCSSCPPAEQVLAGLAARPDVIALGFHVDYWNGIGWHDRFSAPAFTARQVAYARRLGIETYTPALVVNGGEAVVGSDQAAVAAALAHAAAPGIAVRATRNGNAIDITVGQGAGTGQVILIGYDPTATTDVQAGENAGRHVTDVNPVRSVRAIGAWRGTALTLRAPLPPGSRFAVLVESDRILGAAPVM